MPIINVALQLKLALLNYKLLGDNLYSIFMIGMVHDYYLSSVYLVQSSNDTRYMYIVLMSPFLNAPNHLHTHLFTYRWHSILRRPWDFRWRFSSTNIIYQEKI